MVIQCFTVLCRVIELCSAAVSHGSNTVFNSIIQAFTVFYSVIQSYAE